VYRKQLGRGLAPAKLSACKADVSAEYLAESFNEWLKTPTLRGWLRRAGLR